MNVGIRILVKKIDNSFEGTCLESGNVEIAPTENLLYDKILMSIAKRSPLHVYEPVEIEVWQQFAYAEAMNFPETLIKVSRYTIHIQEVRLQS